MEDVTAIVLLVLGTISFLALTGLVVVGVVSDWQRNNRGMRK